MAAATLNPWDVLPRNTTGDVAPEPLFLAVGKALTSWEILDDRQAGLFGTLVNSRQGTAEVAYGTITASSGRADMVIAAADRLFGKSHQSLLQEIKSLVERVGKLAARRNEIAHGTVTNFIIGYRNSGYYLVPAGYNTRKFITKLQEDKELKTFTTIAEMDAKDYFPFGQFKYAYTSEQIIQYANNFVSFKTEMVNLLFRVKSQCDELFPSLDKPQ